MKTKTRQKWLLFLIVFLILLIVGFIFLIGHETTSAPKIGLILTGKTDDPGWNGTHYAGIMGACEKLGAKLYVEENVAESSEACGVAIEKLAREGVSMIILSSYAYPEKVMDFMQKYPDIAFYTSSAEISLPNLTTYFGRMYQARYLAGIVAGMKTESGSIGYVAAMENPEVIRGINAFTLGVHSVNPDATVHVILTGSWENEIAEKDAATRLINEVNVDVLTYHHNKPTVASVADAAGIYSIGYNEIVSGLSDKHLTSTAWNWQPLYYEIIREFVSGKANTSNLRWLGLESKVIGLSDYSSMVTPEIQQAVTDAQADIIAGKDIFLGELYDNTGVLRCETGEALSDEYLMKQLDWYVDGVVIYE